MLISRKSIGSSDAHPVVILQDIRCRFKMATMGEYSHVHGGCLSVPPKRLRLLDVSIMAMRAEIATIAFWRAVIAECLASLLHVLFGCLATLTCPGYVDASARTLLISLCFGLTVATLVQCFQHISGAHLNPVVSLVQALTCKVTPLRAFLFALAHTGGAVAGAAILHGITTGTCQAELGVTVLHYGLSPWQGLGIEILLTFILVFCICATVDPNRNDTGSKALVIGLAVTGCHLAGYRFTGASMNPARSLGPAFVAAKWSNHWIYWAGPTLGGVTAGLLYEFIFDPSRLKSRAKPRSIPDPEDESNAPPLMELASTSTSRHYYNNNHATLHHNQETNILGSPRSTRRSDATANSSTNIPPTTNSTSIGTNTSTPNHYVPGTYGERALIDIKDYRRTNFVDDASPPANNVRFVSPHDDIMTPVRRNIHDDVIYGRRTGQDGMENQAYAFDSHPRRLQSPAFSPQRNMIPLFSDGRETICLSDVRVF